MGDTEDKRLKGSERMKAQPKKVSTHVPPIPYAGPIRETDCSEKSHGLVPRACNISSSHSIRKMDTLKCSFFSYVDSPTCAALTQENKLIQTLSAVEIHWAWGKFGHQSQITPHPQKTK